MKKMTIIVSIGIIILLILLGILISLLHNTIIDLEPELEKNLEDDFEGFGIDITECDGDIFVLGSTDPIGEIVTYHF
jgi:hypothetical protein